MPEIVELLVSGAHRWSGRPSAAAAAAHAPQETLDRIELRAGLGVVGDRYFNSPAHRDASVTLIAAEPLAPWPGAGLVQTRRTVLLHGVDVDAHLGDTVSLDSGDGPVLLRIRRAAHPCRWLDLAVGAGAWKALRGHGGVRCEPLTDGLLRVGPVDVAWHCRSMSQG